MRGASNQFHIFHQCTLGRSQAGFIELALKDCLYALIGRSLNTQEVGMAVQSIWAPIQVRNVAGDHLLMTSGEMAFGEVDRIRELNYLLQEIRPCAETLNDARD